MDGFYTGSSPMHAVLARLRGPDMDDHLRLFEAIDWSATSLGPLDSWPQELATQVFLTMLLPDAQSLVLGEDMVVIYNQAYGRLIRDHHPGYFGRPVASWTEWLPYFEKMAAIYAQAEKTGRAWVTSKFPMIMDSGGFKENVDFSCAVICLPPPLRGFLGSFKETTATAAAEKRHSILEDLIPEAARKRRETVRRQRLESELQRKEAELAALRVERITKIVGLANVAIFERDLSGRLVFANDAFYKLVSTHKDQNDGISFLPSENWDALLRGESQTFELRCLKGTWGLCSALPTRDQDGQIDSVIGVVTDIESQKRAEQEARAKVDALEKARIAEKRYFRFMEIIPSGIAVANSAGQIIYATEAWFEMSGHRHCDFDQVSWRSVIHEEDLKGVEKQFYKLSRGSQPLEFQFRMRRPWINSAGENCGSSWMLCNALPELREDGSVERVVSSITDISHLKFAESVNFNRVEEANESKKHALAFIDMTSHEIRNPLGAVIHCADSVSECLTELRMLLPDQEIQSLEADTGSAKSSQHLTQLIEAGTDAVNTILSCSEHMTNIITDTLTLSKLDANLLRISPSAVRSVSMIQDIRKMFEVETKRLDVNFSTIVDSSLAAQGAEWMAIDSGRVMQILINLVSNAIKFTKTKTSGRKDVTVRVGASKTHPLDLPVDFTIARALQDSIYDTAEFSENTCFLWFTVEDTGIGMNSEEQNRIFSRFAQGSIRTHKTYGGSGLGLFISRTLSELQGGEIGVSSEAGKGSTFAFFVKAHTTSPPQVQENGHDVSRHSSPATHDLKPGKIPVSVLIVEDNAVNQRVLERSLKVKGYVTHVADHGQEALDFLKTTKLWKGNESSSTAPDIDVILMGSFIYILWFHSTDTPFLQDVEMPIMDGLECARRIRNYQRTSEMRSNLPIIAASANARPEQIQMALEAGMDDSITKPFRIPELTPKIDSFAAWARAQG
ncbi:putative histidine kinase HHK19p, partial [Aureobasidium melanogenum]